MFRSLSIDLESSRKISQLDRVSDLVPESEFIYSRMEYAITSDVITSDAEFVSGHEAEKNGFLAQLGLNSESEGQTRRVSTYGGDPEMDRLIDIILQNTETYEEFVDKIAGMVSSGEITMKQATLILGGIQRKSNKTTYLNILNDAATMLVANLNFGDCAYMESDDLAKVGHEHDYSKFEISQRRTDDLNLKISTFHLSGLTDQPQRIDLYSMSFMQPRQINAKIGDLKFVLRGNYEPAPLTSDDFDGWVFADGRSYSRQQFPKAYDVFRTNGTGTSTTFNVPRIENFILPCPSSEEALQMIDPTYHVYDHNHAVSMEDVVGKTFRANILANAYYSGLDSNSANGGKSVIHSNFGTQHNKLDVRVKLRENNNSITTQDNVKTNILGVNPTSEGSYPDYRRVSVLVYIGEKA